MTGLKIYYNIPGKFLWREILNSIYAVSKQCNSAYAGLRHAIVITTKPRFVVKRTCNTEVRLGGDNNSVT